MLTRLASWVLVSGAILAQEPPPEPADVGVLGAAEPLLVTDYEVEVVREGPAYQAAARMALRSPRSTPIEGVALIPIPEAAIARGFFAENGDVGMRGVVRARTGAIDVYRGITRATIGGRDPAILERLGDRWMRATIAPIAAGGKVRLTVGYLGFTEKLGHLREVLLPSERTAFRGAWAGSSRRLLPGELDAGPMTTWCFRAPGSDGAFCLELDPRELLAQPLGRATYLLVHEAPESTSDALAEAGAEALRAVVAALAPDDRVELFADGCDGGLLGAPAPADDAVRAKLGATLRTMRARGWGRLDARIEAALAVAAASPGPVRLVIASAQRRVVRAGELGLAIGRAAMRSSAFGCFTCALGNRADASALARLAAAGRGRAFSILAPEEAAAVVGPLVDAARHPVLLAPRVSVAGATEVIVESKRHVTFGETLRVSGRYAEECDALVRLEGHVLERPVDAMHATTFPDEALAHPWVATTWAGLRAREIEDGATGDDAASYLVRLAERFSLIDARTVSLGLEPAFEDRLPPLMGAPGITVAQLDPPERPTPPVREVPDGPLERRPPPPPGPRGPTTAPRPPPAQPASPPPGPVRGPAGRGR